ncbi:hypothetical protein F4802DRAFT_574503 [Xylaria palmicola]|nr:hypothetical protein F4802DRAFT_574503 [Xylaria palmicola]
MPSATQADHSMASPSSKKRRREDGGEVPVPLYDPPAEQHRLSTTGGSFQSTNMGPPISRSSALEASQNLLSAINNNERLLRPFNVPRKTAALPVSKRFRFMGDGHHGHVDSHYLHHDDFPCSPLPQPQQSYFSHAHPELNPAAAAAPRTTSSALLSPCYICHRKPTKKTDLDSFGDCSGCGNRTCFVCLRACRDWLPASDGERPDRPAAEVEDLSSVSFTMRDVDDENSSHDDASKTSDAQKPQQRPKKGEGGGGGSGGDSSWNGRGHCDVICSRCCVEQGSEGDVVCLGCLAGMEGV